MFLGSLAVLSLAGQTVMVQAPSPAAGVAAARQPMPRRDEQAKPLTGPP